MMDDRKQPTEPGPEPDTTDAGEPEAADTPRAHDVALDEGDDHVDGIVL